MTDNTDIVSSRVNAVCHVWLRSFVLALAFVVMLGRGLLPEGWMPGFSATGTTITICSEDGPRQITLDRNGQPIPAHTPSHGLCAFALSGHANLLPSLPVIFPRTAASFLTIFFLKQLPPFAALRTEHPPRAPPAGH